MIEAHLHFFNLKPVDERNDPFYAYAFDCYSLRELQRDRTFQLHLRVYGIPTRIELLVEDAIVGSLLEEWDHEPLCFEMIPALAAQLDTDFPEW